MKGLDARFVKYFPGHVPQYPDDIATKEYVDSGGEVITAMSMSVALKGVSPAEVYLQGVYQEISAGVTGNLPSPIDLGNNHLALNINSITGAGNVTVTGDSISEASAVPVLNDTEVIAISEVANYETAKKWLNVSAIVFDPAITAINYDIIKVGYWDALNTDFEVIGYRVQVVPTNASTAVFKFEILKLKSLGDRKISLVPLEDITLKGVTPFIQDNVRTGASDRSYTVANQLENEIPTVLKQGDIIEHFGSESTILGGSGEGAVVRINWLNLDYAIITLYTRYLQNT